MELDADGKFWKESRYLLGLHLLAQGYKNRMFSVDPISFYLSCQQEEFENNFSTPTLI